MRRPSATCRRSARARSRHPSADRSAASPSIRRGLGDALIRAMRAPHRGHAQSGRRRAGRRRAPPDRAEHRVRLCAGPEPHAETDPLDRGGRWAESPSPSAARARYGAAVLMRQALEAIVLRYGLLLRSRHLEHAQAASRRCMSMPPRRRPCLRSRAARRASTTSPTTTERCRSRRLAGSSASIRLSGCRSWQRFSEKSAHQCSAARFNLKRCAGSLVFSRSFDRLGTAC